MQEYKQKTDLTRLIAAFGRMKEKDRIALINFAEASAQEEPARQVNYLKLVTADGRVV